MASFLVTEEEFKFINDFNQQLLTHIQNPATSPRAAGLFGRLGQEMGDFLAEENAKRARKEERGKHRDALTQARQARRNGANGHTQSPSPQPTQKASAAGKA